MTSGVIELLRKPAAAATAIVDCSSDRAVSYGELCREVERVGAFLGSLPGKPLVFLRAINGVDSLVAHLACLHARVPLALFEASSEAFDEEMLRRYGNPHLVEPSGSAAPRAHARTEAIPGTELRLSTARKDGGYSAKIHPSLALMLQTSGSTGSPKLVRLTWEAVRANAQAIAQYLGIVPAHRSMQSLPMSYSYGLSLIHSHLFSGASIALSAHSFLRPEFWQDFDRSACTSFAGVPFMYETLEKLRFDPKDHPSLKIMTQAGGALRPELVKRFAEKCAAAGARFHAMYGQTEATARIAQVPPERLLQKLGSIGIPIPGGRIELCDVPEMPGRKELVFFGPSVMMGYAEGAESLALGDELHGRLATGDLARVDEEGYYYLEGRLKRFAKLYGLRIQLDDVEKKIESSFPVRAAALDRGEAIQVFLESESAVESAKVQQLLASWLQLPAKAFLVETIDALPRSPSGKKDYNRLVLR